MKVTIDAELKDWWIERRDKGAEAMVRFRGKADDDGKEYDFEKRKEGTIDECVAFVKEQFKLESRYGERGVVKERSN